MAALSLAGSNYGCPFIPSLGMCSACPRQQVPFSHLQAYAIRRLLSKELPVWQQRPAGVGGTMTGLEGGVLGWSEVLRIMGNEKEG